jgi:hypothetical protein
MKTMRTNYSLVFIALCAVAACARSPRAVPNDDVGGARASSGNPDEMAAPNTLTSRERSGGWTLLFDGKSLDGWQRYDGAPITAGWKAVDGALVRAERGGSDIVTTRKYRNYELALEWRLSPEGPAGNSGIFYNVIDTGGIYWGAPEMQILDDARHADGKSDLTSTGANYALHPVPHGGAKPVGEWNAVRIVRRGDHVEHWLNGQKVVDYDLGSADWKTRVAASKFKDKLLYGTAREGRIGLQEHGSFVAFRNIRIKETK